MFSQSRLQSVDSSAFQFNKSSHIPKSTQKAVVERNVICAKHSGSLIVVHYVTVSFSR